MKLVFSLLFAGALANQLAAPNAKLQLDNPKSLLKKPANCAIFDQPASNLAELNEQKIHAEACNQEFSIDLANVKKFYNASPKSLLDRAIATALAMNGEKSEFLVIKNKIDLAKSLVKSSDMYDWSRFENEAGVSVMATAVDTIVAVARMTQEKLLSSDEILFLANSFLLSEPKTETDTAYISLALAALNDDASGLAKPVKFVKSGVFPKINYQLLDVFNNQVSTARFFIKMNDEVLDLPADGNADFSTFNLQPGLHEYELSVSGADMYAGFSTKTFKIFVPSTEKVEVINEEVKIIKKSGEVGSSATIGDKILVKFELSGNVNPHQAMVKFSNGNLEGFALAKVSHGHEGVYTATVEVSKSEEAVFSSVSGDWSVEILVADITMITPVQKSVGKVKLVLTGDGEIENNSFQPMKTINHIFPEPESRPPVTVSLLFTGLTLAPLGLLIVLWGVVGMNFKGLNLSIWGLIFHVAVGAVLALYVSYWLGKFNMFFTVRYLAIIGVVLLISGNKHLNAMAKDRKIITAEKPKSD